MSLEVLADQEAHLHRALTDALAKGLPAVRGEDVGEDTGGYHFYPADEQIREWLDAARMQIVEDRTDDDLRRLGLPPPVAEARSGRPLVFMA